MKNKPNKVLLELKRIAAANDGILKPEIVVEKARPVSSPLHTRFTWDDGEAAHRYRIWEARKLIAVAVEVIAGVEGEIDAFVSLTTDRNVGGGYRVVTEVLSDRELKQQMLVDAANEMELFRQKYIRLKELAGVFQAISKVRKKIKR